MKILHISDTHGRHRALELPPADVLVHSGDFTFGGSEAEAYDFMDWFCDLPYRHKVFIAGNHDICMLDCHKVEGLPDGVHFLYDSGVVLEGLKFYGVPLFVDDVMTGRYEQQLAAVPEDCDVLVTHQPPWGILDYRCDALEHTGSRFLADRLPALTRLRAHLFGHEHDAAGLVVQDGVVYSNAAAVDSLYRMTLPCGHLVEVKDGNGL